MKLTSIALAALCVAPLCAPVGASAQQQKQQSQDKWDNPWDLKPLVPPVFTLPPNAQLNSGATTGTPSYSATPQQSRGLNSQSSPGVRLSIPTDDR
jgi:hypothetical protein